MVFTLTGTEVSFKIAYLILKYEKKIVLNSKLISNTAMASIFIPIASELVIWFLKYDLDHYYIYN